MKVFGKDPIRAALLQVLGLLLSEETELILASTENLDDVREDLESGKIVIFYDFESEASLRMEGNPAAPWFYSSNAAYCQVPFLLVDMILVYEKIKKGEKVKNNAARLAARFGHKQSLVSVLLHDLSPGHSNMEPRLQQAEKEFGFTGSPKEVCDQLEKIRDKKEVGVAYEIIGDEMLTGVFCDVEGTLLSNDRTTINPDVLATLKSHSDKAVTLWTGGDVKELENVLYRLDVKEYPVVGKEIFRGCTVEIVYDDLSQKEFKKQYGIKAKTFNQV